MREGEVSGDPILGGPHFTQTPVRAELATTNYIARKRQILS